MDEKLSQGVGMCVFAVLFLVWGLWLRRKGVSPDWSKTWTLVITAILFVGGLVCIVASFL